MHRMTVLLAALLLVSTTAPRLHADPLCLVKGGVPQVCVVVAPEVLEPPDAAGKPDADLQLLRWAADDLTHYLAEITGAIVSVGTNAVDALTPIYVGCAPQPPELSVQSEFGDAYLIEALPEQIVLAGETARAVYYAAAHLLHDIGVRWYAPTSTGEVIPKAPTLSIPTSRLETTPDFHTRGLWADRRWALRNRMGGPQMAQGHAFANRMGGSRTNYFPEHPEYYPIVNGVPRKTQANLSHPDVVDLFTDSIRAELRAGNHWAGSGAAIGPDDGALLDERPESVAMDSGRTDPFLQLPSATDRLVKFCNQVARDLEDEFPHSYLGFYVYSNHNLPPQTVAPHRMLMPIVAPITYNRYTSIGQAGAPTSKYLEYVIRAWAEKSSRLGCYLYNFNLADTAMPFTRTRTWAKTFPNLHQWGVRYATIESMDDNWHCQVPGNYVLAQLLWDTDVDVDALLNEFYRLYYGPAEDAMRRYHTVLEDAYEDTSAYAGNLWSMHRILTRPVMELLTETLSKAEKQARRDNDVRARVEVARTALTFASHFLAAREALNDGDFEAAAKWSERFRENYDQSVADSPGSFGRNVWSYYSTFHHRSFADAGRVAREGRILYRFPNSWPAFFDANNVGIDDQIYQPGVDTSDWIMLRTHGVSLDEQGFPFYRGTVWYRRTFDLPPKAREADRLLLWFGGIDDTATVYLNGRPLGRLSPGNFGPAEIDITSAVEPDGINCLAVAVSNLGITELGTGGLCRPVVIYTSRAGSDDATDDARPSAPYGSQPLFGGDAR